MRSPTPCQPLQVISDCQKPDLCELTDPYPADTTSHGYQYLSDIQPSIENVTSNDQFDELFEDVDDNLNPLNVFNESHEQQMLQKLSEYVERGPSPTQCNDEEWNEIMDTSINPAARLSVPQGQPAAAGNMRSSITPGLTPDVVHSANKSPASKATVSPATPHSSSQPIALLAHSCSPPTMDLSKNSHKKAVKPRNTPNARPNGDMQGQDYTNNGESGRSIGQRLEFAEPDTTQEKLPARPSVGRPFRIDTGPARKATAAMMEALDLPLPADDGVSTFPQVQTGFDAQNMFNTIDLTTESTSNSLKPSPNPAPILRNAQYNNSFQVSSQNPQQKPTKRLRVGSKGSPQMIRHSEFLQGQQMPGTNQTPTWKQNRLQGCYAWLDTQVDNQPVPQAMIPDNSGSTFNIPLPSGWIDEQGQFQPRGQKRTASQMMVNNFQEHGIQDSYGAHGQVTQVQDDANGGLFIHETQQGSNFMPHQGVGQGSMPQTSLMQRSKAVPRGRNRGMTMTDHISQPMNNQMSPSVRNQMRLSGSNHRNSSMQGHTMQNIQSQVQAEPQYEMDMQAQFHQFTNITPNAGGNNLHQQNTQATPKFGPSPRNIKPGPNGTPTPAPRRRSTLSEPGPNISSSHLANNTGYMRQLQQKNMNKRQIQGQLTPSSSSQPKTPNGGMTFQMPNGQTIVAPPSKQTPTTAQQYGNFQTPTPLRAHLPTPQQPVSTGLCPNTVNETLEETNRRTEAQLRELGAEVVDFDPNFVPNTAFNDILNDQTAFQLPDSANDHQFGLPDENGELGFASLMGSDMNLDMDLNMNSTMNLDMNQNMTLDMNSNINCNMNSDMTLDFDLPVDPTLEMFPSTTTSMQVNTTPDSSANVEMNISMAGTSSMNAPAIPMAAPSFPMTAPAVPMNSSDVPTGRGEGNNFSSGIANSMETLWSPSVAGSQTVTTTTVPTAPAPMENNNLARSSTLPAARNGAQQVFNGAPELADPTSSSSLMNFILNSPTLAAASATVNPDTINPLTLDEDSTNFLNSLVPAEQQLQEQVTSQAAEDWLQAFQETDDFNSIDWGFEA